MYLICKTVRCLQVTPKWHTGCDMIHYITTMEGYKNDQQVVSANT